VQELVQSVCSGQLSSSTPHEWSVGSSRQPRQTTAGHGYGRMIFVLFVSTTVFLPPPLPQAGVPFKDVPHSATPHQRSVRCTALSRHHFRGFGKGLGLHAPAHPRFEFSPLSPSPIPAYCAFPLAPPSHAIRPQGAINTRLVPEPSCSAIPFATQAQDRTHSKPPPHPPLAEASHAKPIPVVQQSGQRVHSMRQPAGHSGWALVSGRKIRASPKQGLSRGCAPNPSPASYALTSHVA